MDTILAFFRLIRVPNLLIIFLTQHLLRYCLLQPILSNGFVAVDFSLTHLQFFYLSLSTVLIAAAGYIINDYFDVKADEVNRPNRIVIDRFIGRRQAIILHFVLNAIGIAIGFWLAVEVGNWLLGFIHIGTMAMLWFYSTWFKRTFLFGNLVIGGLTALVVLIVLFYETSLESLNGRISELYHYLHFFFWGYAGFAFLVTLLRELVKDMEDIKGDRLLNCRTIPIVLGIKRSKNIAIFLALLVIGFLAWYQVLQAMDFQEKDGSPFYKVRSIRLIFAFLQIPLFYIIILLMEADKSVDFKKVSNMVKFVMVAGVLFLTYYLGTVGV